MSELTNEKSYQVWFESFEEMERELPALIGRVNGAQFKQRVIDKTSAYGGRSWHGTDGGAPECFRLIKEGWPEMLKTLQPMIERLRTTFSLDNAAALNVEVRRRKVRRMDHGDSLDITRVWNGQLDTAWSKPVKFPRISASQKYATIYFDAATPGAVDAKDTLWRAAAAICMIEVLTRMGVNTEVWVGSTGTSPYEYGTRAPGRFLSAVRVKAFTDPLNEDRMATMLSCAFYRTWGFGMYMAGPWRASLGLGTVSPCGLPQVLQERADAGQRTFTFHGCLSFEQAARNVAEVVSSIERKQESAA